jgi:FMN phosphatase YigB (HAD superfamily)
MIRAILFDFDDTLVDFHPSNPRALFDAGAARVYAFLTAKGCSLPAFEPFSRRQRSINRQIEWKTRLTGGEPDGRRLLRRLCKDYGLQRDAACLAKLGWLWYEPVTETAALAADVIPTLTTLRDAGIELALIANTIHHDAVIDRHLETLGVLEFFPVRAYSTEHAARKPDPHLFNAALDELGVPASQAMFVGNELKADILGARRIGMQTVLRAAEPPRRAVELADHTIERLSELLPFLGIEPRNPAPAQLQSLAAT